MSKIVNKDDLTDGEIAKIYKYCKASKTKTPFLQFPKPIKLFGYDGKRFWVPMAMDLHGMTYNDYYGIPDKKAKYEFSGKLYEGYDDPKGENRNQVKVLTEALEDLASQGTAFLHVSTGYGKSVILTALLHSLGLKAAVIVFSQQLQTDILKTMKTLTTAKICHFKSTKEPPLDTDIDVMGLKKASSPKLTSKFFSRYSVIIFDEVDQLPSEKSIPLLQKIAPRYLIGLTATVERSDGLHSVLYKYWGNKKYFITRFVKKSNATIIKYQTNFVPEIEYESDGTVNNVTLTNSLAYNEKRHASIEKLIRSLYPQKQLWLSDREDEIVAIYNRIKDLDADYKTGVKKDMDKNKKILIGGHKSCGRGYDVPGLEVVGMLTSFRNVKQYEGRLRSESGTIYDFVDCAPILEARWKTRLTWYRKRDFNIKFQIDGMDDVRDYNPPRGSRPPKNTKYKEISIL